jgi:hypothetical protein
LLFDRVDCRVNPLLACHSLMRITLANERGIFKFNVCPLLLSF